MGATMLTGQSGNIAIPRKAKGAAVAAATENATSTETTPSKSPPQTRTPRRWAAGSASSEPPAAGDRPARSFH